MISYPNISIQWFLLGIAADKKPFQKCRPFYELFGKVWLVLHITYMIM